MRQSNIKHTIFKRTHFIVQHFSYNILSSYIKPKKQQNNKYRLLCFEWKYINASVTHP